MQIALHVYVVKIAAGQQGELRLLRHIGELVWLKGLLGIALRAARTVSKASIAETKRITLGEARTVSRANIAETLGAAPVRKEAARVAPKIEV